MTDLCVACSRRFSKRVDLYQKDGHRYLQEICSVQDFFNGVSSETYAPLVDGMYQGLQRLLTATTVNDKCVCFVCIHGSLAGVVLEGKLCLLIVECLCTCQLISSACDGDELQQLQASETAMHIQGHQDFNAMIAFSCKA